MKKGFSTVELLAATAIIGIVIIAIYLSFVLSTQLQSRAKQITIATNEAELSLESQRNKAFDDLALGDETETLITLPSGEKTISITQIDDQLKKISVNVSWQSGSVSKNVTLESLASAGGINDISGQ